MFKKKRKSTALLFKKKKHTLDLIHKSCFCMCEIFNAEKMISKKLNKFVILQNRVVFSMILDSNVIVFSFLHSKKKEKIQVNLC